MRLIIGTAHSHTTLLYTFSTPFNTSNTSIYLRRMLFSGWHSKNSVKTLLVCKYDAALCSVLTSVIDTLAILFPVVCAFHPKPSSAYSNIQSGHNLLARENLGLVDKKLEAAKAGALPR